MPPALLSAPPLAVLQLLMAPSEVCCLTGTVLFVAAARDAELGLAPAAVPASAAEVGAVGGKPRGRGGRAPTLGAEAAPPLPNELAGNGPRELGVLGWIASDASGG